MVMDSKLNLMSPLQTIWSNHSFTTTNASSKHVETGAKLGLGSEFGLKPAHVMIAIMVLVLTNMWWRSFDIKNPTNLPVIGRRWYELGYGKARNRFSSGAPSLVRDCLKKYGDAFYLYTDYRYRLILSHKYADTIRNESRLNFIKAMQEGFHQGVKGFEPLAHMASDARFIHEVTKVVLTRSLGSLIEPLTDECDFALEQSWTNSADTQEILLKDGVWKVVSQVISRILFDDEELYRNPEWIRLSVDYVNETFLAARDLRFWPKSMRKVVSPFLPRCQRLYGQLKRADELLKPLIEKLRAGKVSNDKKVPIEWLLKESDASSFDIAAMVLALCLGSFDASSEAVCYALCDISDNKNLIQDLRTEIVKAVGPNGFSKNSLQNMVLMESVLKESQRLHPVAYLNMQRLAMEEVTLPDGLVIPKDTAVMVSGCHMMDSTVWSNGDEFDGYRYYNLRQSESTPQATHNFTTTSPEHMGFGHGKQACPGRFFANYELKIILAHMIMKYDFDVVSPPEGNTIDRAYTIAASPNLKVKIRRRQEEVTLRAEEGMM